MRRGRARRFGYAGLACVLAVGAVVAIPGLSRSILPFNPPPGAHPAPATDGTGQFSHNTNGGDGPSGGSGNGDGNGSNANGGNPGNHPSGNGSGTGVTASVGNVVAKPSSYQGSCPAAVTLNAIIGVNHGPATVTYRWVRGDGTTSSSQTVEFPSGGAQTRQVTTTWQLGSPSTTTTGWGAVELQTPNPAQSTHANFTLTCAPPPPPCTFSVAPASVHLGPTESHLSVTLHAGARQLVWRSPTPAVTAVFLDRTSGTVKAGGSDTVTGSVSREALYQGTAPVTFTADCGERHTVSVTWDAAPPPPPAVHTSGDLSIPETYQADLDEGVVPGSGSDIWFEEAGPPTERYITPQNGATIAVTSTLATSPEQCAQAPLGTARIPMTTLDTGSTLCARTNQGRYSAVTLTGMPGPIPGTLTIHFTTWE